MDGRTDGWTDRISPHSTGHCPLSGPLPSYFLRLGNIKEAGQGNRCLMMPFGDWFIHQSTQSPLQKPPKNVPIISGFSLYAEADIEQAVVILSI